MDPLAILLLFSLMVVIGLSLGGDDDDDDGGDLVPV